MISSELQKKIEQSIKLLQVTCGDDVVEIAYSGGKDSDVILQLAKEAGIKYRAIYKNTTIDPKGTIKHCKDMGVEEIKPTMKFIDLIQKYGFPNRRYRFCCKVLKEYKVLDKSVIGIRKEESVKRAKNYKEPTECRFYGSKKNHVEAIYPILDWTNSDVKEFIEDRGVVCAPVYYMGGGQFDVNQRLGCMCCPLQSFRKRIESFKMYPNMVKLYCRNGQIYIQNHPNSKIAKEHKDVYSWFYRDVLCRNTNEYEMTKSNLFGKFDYKGEIEKTFNVSLPNYSILEKENEKADYSNR